MKKAIIITLFTGFVFSCEAQILPIEKKIDFIIAGNGIPENIIYFQDHNNLLNKFTGIWKGTYGDKIFEFRILKNTYKPGRIKEDILIIRYLITSVSGVIIEDTRDLTDSNPLVIKGDYIESSTYALRYIGTDIQCGQAGTIFIDWLKDSNKTKMTLFLEPEQMIISSEKCPNGIVEQIIPQVQIILTKQ
jgi:hypothetical protein